MASLTLGTNIASLQGARRLSENSDALSRTFERLSSGLRINHASDDAAGLAVQSGLNLNRRVYAQGIRNINDGISLINIADSTLSQTSNIVARLSELAEQSANGSLGLKQRESLNNEALALANEYLRVTRSTYFNGLSLFDGTLQGIRIQSGYGTSGSIFSSLGGAIWNGSFAATSNVTGAITGPAVTTTDLNGDGIQDLLNSTSNGMTVRLGNGDGTFAAATSYDMGVTSSTTISVADVNNDGIMDALVGGANAGVGVVGIRFGVGDGTFGQTTNYSTATTNVYSIAVGDINRDGMNDVVVAGAAAASTTVNTFLGTGGGSLFLNATFSGAGLGQSTDVQLADLNRDGYLDVISSGPAGAPTVALNNGNGTFAAALPSVGYGGNAAKLGDLNGDGKLDIVTISGGNVIVGLGNGDGTFGSGTTIAAGASIVSLQLVDFNGDGSLDIVAGSRFGPTVLTGNGNGTFGTAVASNIMSNTLTGFAVADLNNDGVLDILGANQPDGVRTALSNTKDGVGAIFNFSLSTIADARQALSQFAVLTNRISQQRGTIGAFQSRMNVASAVLEESVAQSAAAESRILDADVGEESAELVRRTILQQTSSAILAQANLQPKVVLSLLQG